MRIRDFIISTLDYNPLKTYGIDAAVSVKSHYVISIFIHFIKQFFEKKLKMYVLLHLIIKTKRYILNWRPEKISL